MATEPRATKWSHSRLLQCQAFPTLLPPQKQGARSASDLLQSYIDRFDRTGDSSPVQQSPSQEPVSADAAGSAEVRPLVQLTAVSDDRDTLELLCGRGSTHGGDGRRVAASASAAAATASGGPPPVSLRTRRILQDVDKHLGHCQPCYSAPDKLDLRTMWPSMHEHLERRWRQQLRARYEAQLREKAALADREKATQGARADLYGGACSRSRQRQLPRLSQLESAQSASASNTREAATLEDKGSVEEDDEGDDTDEAGSDGSICDGTREAINVRTAEATQSEEEGEPGTAARRWGSDSGVGLSCVGASSEGQRPAAAKQQPDTDGSMDCEDDEEEAADRRSFEERMRSYRCVLEAHELSEQLRQRLEVACAVRGGPRVLTTDQKGRIRDRLANLQHPELAPLPEVQAASAAASGTDATSIEAKPSSEQQQQQRISTERLAHLMSSALGLLPEGGDRATVARQQQQQQQLLQQANGSN